jgi:hypothetical protein
MYRFYRRRTKRPDYNVVGIDVEDATPRYLQGQQQNTHNYSPALHLSTKASLALKSSATLHTSGSARILRITDPNNVI